MKTIRGIDRLRAAGRKDVVLTIGNFDGVHLGHQKTIKRVVEAADALGCTSMAMTFEPHPTKVLAPERGVRLLTPMAQKARLMAHYGLASLLVVMSSARGFYRVAQSPAADSQLRVWSSTLFVLFVVTVVGESSSGNFVHPIWYVLFGVVNNLVRLHRARGTHEAPILDGRTSRREARVTPRMAT